MNDNDVHEINYMCMKANDVYKINHICTLRTSVQQEIYAFSFGQ